MTREDRSGEMLPLWIGPLSTRVKYVLFFLFIALNMAFWINFNSAHPQPERVVEPPSVRGAVDDVEPASAAH